MKKGNTKTLLLVEDEAIIALNEQLILEKHGYGVKTVHTGEKAVETARDTPEIDLVLMDIDLGSGIDGTEAAQRILSEVDLPIVFLTSHTEAEYVDRVRGITGYGYVVKHSGEFVLTESIRMALELFEAHQQAKEREAILKETIDEAPIGIFETRFDGTVRFVNNELARILGADATDKASDYYTDLAAQAYARPGRRKEFLRLLERQQVVRGFEFEGRRVDGESVLLRMNARIVNRHSERGPAISGFIVDETERRTTQHQLAERLKELRCLYELERLPARKDTNVEDVLQEAVDLLPRSWQYPEVTCARVILHDTEVTTASFRESPWSMAADIRVDDDAVGSVEVFYLQDKPEADEGPFLTEERALIDAVAGRIAEWFRGAQLFEQKELQSQLLEAVDEAVIATDLNGSVTYWNTAAEGLYGWKASEALGKNIAELTVPEMSQEQAKAIMDSVSVGNTWAGELTVQNREGNRFPARVSNSPVYSADGTIRGVVGVSYDLSEERNVAEELKHTGERYKRAERTAHLGHWEMEIATGRSVWSDEFFRICGYEPQSFSPTPEIGSNIIHPEDRDRVARRVQQAIETGEPYSIEKRVVRPDGEIRWVYSRGEVVRTGEREPAKLIRTFLDITERKKAEERLQATLEEKDRLMSELNHRVKNNLAMVVSLLNLKQQAIGDSADLADIVSQVGAIRSVHEKLQQSEDIDRVDFGSYVHEVLSGVFSTRAHPDVEIENKVGTVSIPTKVATTLGLIVNELATNAAKYGLEPHSEKRFIVALEQLEAPGEYVLTVANTGREFQTT